MNALNGDASQSESIREYNYEDVKQLVATPDSSRVLVDVREKDEYHEGFIPGAVNMPYRSTPKALSLNPQEFMQKFGFGKPSTDKELIFYCASGFRANNARNEAQEAGYFNTSVYPGSWKDWISREDSD